WVDDPDTRVRVAHTAREDLRGVVRVARAFVRGEGKVDLGPFHRAPISDDMGRQFVSFAAVGTVSTAVSLLIFLILQREIHPLWANVGALLGTSLANAWANRRFTFGHRSRVDRGRHYLGAALMLATALIVSSSLLALVLWRDGGLVAQCLALAASSVVTAIGRFALLRSWVFRDPPAQVSGDTVVTRS
ncbi:MAG TPA: GtrA family protein, partial [Ilumatobacteraceae bacterium]